LTVRWLYECTADRFKARIQERAAGNAARRLDIRMNNPDVMGSEGTVNSVPFFFGVKPMTHGRKPFRQKVDDGTTLRVSAARDYPFGSVQEG
jgi:hypothetical protein